MACESEPAPVSDRNWSRAGMAGHYSNLCRSRRSLRVEVEFRGDEPMRWREGGRRTGPRTGWPFVVGSLAVEKQFYTLAEQVWRVGRKESRTNLSSTSRLRFAAGQIALRVSLML